MGSEYKPESIVPDEVRNALAQLKQAGYRMAVLSNRDRPFLETLETHAISEFFEFSLAGGEVDSYKPEPGLFEHALQRAGPDRGRKPSMWAIITLRMWLARAAPD
jgi:HAD superfamily hydrolase (TIGR01549 family)